MPPAIYFPDYIRSFSTSPLIHYAHEEPWSLTAQSENIVQRMLSDVAPGEYEIVDNKAIHRTAIVETGSILKGPLILGPHCFVAAGAYLRGGCWIDQHCVFGPGAELKSSFVFSRTKLAHFNFVGDSILGEDVNLEAGSILCNYRNERSNKEIRVCVGGTLHKTGRDKFGALLGDGCRVGANAVLAPGAILVSGSVVRRAALLDQEGDGC